MVDYREILRLNKLKYTQRQTPANVYLTLIGTLDFFLPTSLLCVKKHFIGFCDISDCKLFRIMTSRYIYKRQTIR